MENASKALIIAGAILISILLITVGIAVMNAAGSATDDVGSTADSLSKQTFNSQFTAYEGAGRSANDVKALISLIKSSNGAIKQAGANLTDVKTTDKYVYLKSGTHTVNGRSKTCITSTASLATTSTYTVEITKYSKGGYVQEIAIYK